MSNNNNKSIKSLKEDYCSGDETAKICTDYRMKKNTALAEEHLKNYRNDRLGGVSTPDTNKMNAEIAKIAQGIEKRKASLENAKAELERTQDPVNRCITIKTEVEKLSKGQELTEDGKKDIENRCIKELSNETDSIETNTRTLGDFYDTYLPPAPNEQRNMPPTFKAVPPPAVICDKKCQERKQNIEITKRQNDTLAHAKSDLEIHKKILNDFDKKQEERRKARIKAAEEKRKKEEAKSRQLSAAGGARKSRKHKRTRKHMRKHTRKHKVMKSKMTKSKSKKVMQKGGNYGAHGKGMNEFWKKQQEATRKNLNKVKGLRVATHLIKTMKEEEKKRKRRK